MPVVMKFKIAPVIKELPEEVSSQFVGLEIPVNSLEDIVYVGRVNVKLVVYQLPLVIEEAIAVEKDQLIIAAYRRGRTELAEYLFRLNCDKFMFHPSLVSIS